MEYYNGAIIDDKPSLKETYLSHYGVKGMKWGVRRTPEQLGHVVMKKDGSLTSAAQKRYEELYSMQRAASKSDEYQKRLEKLKNEKGIFSVDDSTDAIKKGSVAKRIANQNEPIDTKVKYISMLDNDSWNYIDTAKNEGLEYDSNTVQKEYVFTKDLKVASAKAVRDYIMQEHGDVELKEYKDYFKRLAGEKAAKEMVRRYGKIKLKDIYDPEKGDKVFNLLSYNQYNLEDIKKTKIDDIIHERTMAGQTIARRMFKEELYFKGDKIYDHFRKLGYDAIVDVEDQNEELFDYPLIVLNPKDSMKFVKNNDISDFDLFTARYMADHELD